MPNSKDTILNAIRENLKQFPFENEFESVDFESPIFASSHTNKYDEFCSKFINTGGKLVECTVENFPKRLKNTAEKQKWENIFCKESDLQAILREEKIEFSLSEADFLEMQVGISQCEYLVAHTGSLLVSSKMPSGRRINAFAPIHVVVARAEQIVAMPEDALHSLQAKYSSLPSSISLITGASRTADIEKTLVMGAHGPKELWLFLLKK